MFDTYALIAWFAVKAFFISCVSTTFARLSCYMFVYYCICIRDCVFLVRLHPLFLMVFDDYDQLTVLTNINIKTTT